MPQNKIPNRPEFLTLDTQMVHLFEDSECHPDSRDAPSPSITGTRDLMRLTQAILPVSTPSLGHNIDQKCRGIL